MSSKMIGCRDGEQSMEVEEIVVIKSPDPSKKQVKPKTSPSIDTFFQPKQPDDISVDRKRIENFFSPQKKNNPQVKSCESGICLQQEKGELDNVSYIVDLEKEESPSGKIQAVETLAASSNKDEAVKPSKKSKHRWSLSWRVSKKSQHEGDNESNSDFEEVTGRNSKEQKVTEKRISEKVEENERNIAEDTNSSSETGIQGNKKDIVGKEGNLVGRETEVINSREKNEKKTHKIRKHKTWGKKTVDNEGLTKRTKNTGNDGDRLEIDECNDGSSIKPIQSHALDEQSNNVFNILMSRPKNHGNFDENDVSLVEDIRSVSNAYDESVELNEKGREKDSQTLRSPASSSANAFDVLMMKRKPDDDHDSSKKQKTGSPSKSKNKSFKLNIRYSKSLDDDDDGVNETADSFAENDADISYVECENEPLKSKKKTKKKNQKRENKETKSVSDDVQTEIKTKSVKGSGNKSKVVKTSKKKKHDDSLRDSSEDLSDVAEKTSKKESKMTKVKKKKSKGKTSKPTVEKSIPCIEICEDSNSSIQEIKVVEASDKTPKTKAGSSKEFISPGIKDFEVAPTRTGLRKRSTALDYAVLNDPGIKTKEDGRKENREKRERKEKREKNKEKLENGKEIEKKTEKKDEKKKGKKKKKKDEERKENKEMEVTIPDSPEVVMVMSCTTSERKTEENQTAPQKLASIFVKQKPKGSQKSEQPKVTSTSKIDEKAAVVYEPPDEAQVKAFNALFVSSKSTKLQAPAVQVCQQPAPWPTISHVTQESPGDQSDDSLLKINDTRMGKLKWRVELEKDVLAVMKRRVLKLGEFTCSLSEDEPTERRAHDECHRDILSPATIKTLLSEIASDFPGIPIRRLYKRYKNRDEVGTENESHTKGSEISKKYLQDEGPPKLEKPGIDFSGKFDQEIKNGKARKKGRPKRKISTQSDGEHNERQQKKMPRTKEKEEQKVEERSKGSRKKRGREDDDEKEEVQENQNNKRKSARLRRHDIDSEDTQKSELSKRKKRKTVDDDGSVGTGPEKSEDSRASVEVSPARSRRHDKKDTQKSASSKKKKRKTTDDDVSVGEVPEKSEDSRASIEVSPARLKSKDTQKAESSKRKKRKTTDDDVSIGTVPEKSEDSRASLDDKKTLDKQDLLWTEKYQPECSSEVMGNASSVDRLRSWLETWKIKREKTLRKELELQKKLLAKQAKQKKEDAKQKALEWWEEDHDSDFHLSEEDSDETDGEESGLCNTMFILGPKGAGKTATVYACAKELGYKVFEVNCSSKRSSKQILTRLEEATQSHLVVTNPSANTPMSSAFGGLFGNLTEKPENSSPMSTFFKQTTNETNQKVEKISKKNERKKKEAKNESGRGNEKKRNEKDLSKCLHNAGDSESNPKLSLKAASLILFEEVDVIFEDDKGFWSAVNSFMRNAKCPIIMTSNDARVDCDGRYEQLILKTPSVNLLSAHLEVTALVNNVFVHPAELKALVSLYNCDIRKCLLALQYWVLSGAARTTMKWEAFSNARRDSSATAGRTEDMRRTGGAESSAKAAVQDQEQLLAVLDGEESLFLSLDDWKSLSKRPTRASRRGVKEEDTQNDDSDFEVSKKFPSTMDDNTHTDSVLGGDNDASESQSIQLNEGEAKRAPMPDVHCMLVEHVLGLVKAPGCINGSVELLKETGCKNVFQTKSSLTHHSQCLGINLVNSNLPSLLPFLHPQRSTNQNASSVAKATKASAVSGTSRKDEQSGATGSLFSDTNIFDNGTEDDSNQGRELNDDSNQGRELNEDSNQGRELNDDSNQGRELNDHSNQGRELNDHSNQGRELNDDANQGRELNDHKQTTADGKLPNFGKTTVTHDDRLTPDEVAMATERPKSPDVIQDSKKRRKQKTITDLLQSEALEIFQTLAEDMSHLDAYTPNIKPDTSNHRPAAFGWWHARARPGLSDEGTIIKARDWSTDDTSASIRAALEVASLRSTYSRYKSVMELAKRQNLGGMNEQAGDAKTACDMALTEQLGTCLPCRGSGFLNLNDGMSDAQLNKIPTMNKLYRTVNSSLPLATHCTHRVVCTEYLPSLRTICYSERLREIANTKRRFLHYLDSNSFSLSNSNMHSLADACLTP